METLRNSGSEEAVIDAIKLQNPSGVSVVESDVAPIIDRTLIGSWSSWPPPDVPPSWGDLSAAPGYVIPPDGEENVVNLVLRIRPETPVSEAQEGTEGTQAGFDSIEIEYSVSGEKFISRTATQLVVARSCD